ncbi:MAG: GIY-YIG nuclease family protein [Candidatus Rokubacteria bacterium]|nr:GIY-YIG nuclease family protein [Candidatus Rokubacteria bacterium]MBI3826899.1 GIY-YIG nuclease family protein [Candidatus Rokubacteria bacterium]
MSGRRAARAQAGWCCYLVACADGTLYAGITTHLPRRLAEHDAGRGARYTRGRGPVTLLASEACADRAAASRRETALKRLSRAGKLLWARGRGARRGRRANGMLRRRLPISKGAPSCP